MPDSCREKGVRWANLAGRSPETLTMEAAGPETWLRTLGSHPSPEHLRTSSMIWVWYWKFSTKHPRDDRGLRTHHEQTLDWQSRPTPLTDSGMAKDEPVKADEDTNYATRIITATWGPGATALTLAEQNEQNLNRK